MGASRSANPIAVHFSYSHTELFHSVVEFLLFRIVRRVKRGRFPSSETASISYSIPLKSVIILKIFPPEFRAEEPIKLVKVDGKRRRERKS